ncbi:Scopoletin glucosyltransferase [Bertholletia excelsa]
MGSELKPHVVVFPFMSQGHILPLVDLSKALSDRDILVTIITTPYNSISLRHLVADYSHNIAVCEIPFPAIRGLPKGCENTTQLPSMEFFVPFLEATKQLQKPFEQVLQQLVCQSNKNTICVISDFFLCWTLSSCQAFGLPRLVFHGMGVLALSIIKTAWVHAPSILGPDTSSDDPVHLPGLDIPFVLRVRELPEGVDRPNRDDPFTKFMAEVAEAETNSWGIIVNSFSELEGSYVSCLESFYQNGAKAWCIGPLSLHDIKRVPLSLNNQHPDEMIMKWLSAKEEHEAKVIYVSFGTQAEVTDSQLDEVAYGLEESGHPFVWVVRSATWSLPRGMEERVKGKGLFLLRKWVDQRRILEHAAIGGFMSHCGWNSVLESISVGVPMLAWPMIAEQSLNAKYVVDGLEAGISMPHNKKSFNNSEKVEGVSREVVCKAVKELMEGERGKKARERAQALGRLSRRAIQEGGSSYRALGDLIDELSHVRV